LGRSFVLPGQVFISVGGVCFVKGDRKRKISETEKQRLCCVQTEKTKEIPGKKQYFNVLVLMLLNCFSFVDTETRREKLCYYYDESF
jgi:hypothetical protein